MTNKITNLENQPQLQHTSSIISKDLDNLQTLSEEELQGVVGGQVSERAIIFEPDGTVIKTEPGDVVQTPGGSVVTTFPLNNPFL